MLVKCYDVILTLISYSVFYGTVFKPLDYWRPKKDLQILSRSSFDLTIFSNANNF